MGHEAQRNVVEASERGTFYTSVHGLALINAAYIFLITAQRTPTRNIFYCRLAKYVSMLCMCVEERARERESGGINRDRVVVVASIR